MDENLIVDERQAPLDGAEQATVELHLRNGNLNVSGGATELVDATFKYSNPARRPEMEVSRDGGVVEVEIEQPEVIQSERREINRWNIALNSNVPTELNTAVSSGNAKLDLTDVNLTALDLESSSGSTAVRLAGDYPSLDEVAVNGSSGNIELDLSGTFAVMERLDIETSSGSLDLELTGQYQLLRKCKIATRSGSVRLDLGGIWQHNANIRLDVTSGSIQIRTPPDAGVIAIARVTSGKVSASGFISKNGELHNSSVGVSDITLRLVLDVTSGNIEIV